MIPPSNFEVKEQNISKKIKNALLKLYENVF